MAGTRTAPDVGLAAANKVVTTLHLIDSSGDTFTDTIVTTTTPTVAQIEAYAANYQTNSQASLWKVSQSLEWVGDADPDNAEVGQRNSVKDGINLLFRDIAALKTQTLRLVAPVPATMQGNQDIPLVSDVDFAALITAELAILSSYNLDSAQYTERRERSNNPRIKV